MFSILLESYYYNIGYQSLIQSSAFYPIQQGGYSPQQEYQNPYGQNPQEQTYQNLYRQNPSQQQPYQIPDGSNPQLCQ
ncbi:unnamed protein product, partial [Rotaria sp. Silwood1]